MLRMWIPVFIGGGVGSLLRFGVQCAMHRWVVPFLFPWATLGVNVAGSFLIGLFYVWSARFHYPEDVRLFLTTGLCGGFTTFSTFSHEGVEMLRGGHYQAFFLYVSVSVLAGVASAFLGGWCGESLFGKG